MNPVHKHLFGPVPSRRFGRSLGVDLTPLKTCTLDCVFCQLGHTSRKTLERKEYVPIAEVESELAHWLRVGGKADYITLSGSGEPTLHSGFGRILKFIKKEMPFPAVLLSNGTLFWLPEVREAALAADIVKLSLSAWDPLSFRRINRPHRDLDFHLIVVGLHAFRRAFRGKLWLEVFLVEGVNSRAEDVKKIARLAETIAPDEVHLNTVVRPPAEQSVLAVDQGDMEKLAGLFKPCATIIAGFPTRCDVNIEANENNIMDMLRRRPCTTRQIADAFNMHINEVSKYIGDLTRAQRIQTVWSNGEIYFGACPAEKLECDKPGE
jgi:wyosine [tRNA(Phe)-imidazoG37] synthetase (radical SAM superfamily)